MSALNTSFKCNRWQGTCVFFRCCDNVNLPGLAPSLCEDGSKFGSLLFLLFTAEAHFRGDVILLSRTLGSNERKQFEEGFHNPHAPGKTVGLSLFDFLASTLETFFAESVDNNALAQALERIDPDRDPRASAAKLAPFIEDNCFDPSVLIGGLLPIASIAVSLCQKICIWTRVLHRYCRVAVGEST